MEKYEKEGKEFADIYGHELICDNIWEFLETLEEVAIDYMRNAASQLKGKAELKKKKMAYT